MPAHLCCLVVLLVVALAGAGCDVVDPTDVENPNIQEDEFLGTPGSMRAWRAGVERQAAETISEILLGAELVSDNYFNNRTSFSKVFDELRFPESDIDVARIQFEIAALRNAAAFGLAEVAPADSLGTTDEDLAELHFFKGMGHLYAGEYVVAAPAAPRGEPLPPAAQFQLALEAFEEALALSDDPGLQAGYHLARARTHYHLGNATEAVVSADAALALAPDYVRFAQFDLTGGPANGFEVPICTGQDDFQPLPRLDFLDPKYCAREATEDDPVPLLKAEEAHLIRAEAQLAEGELDAARQTLLDLLGLVATRPVEPVDETTEGRGRGDTFTYPDTNVVRVAASPEDSLRAGLVRDRGAGAVALPIPAVSGTSVTEAMITALSNEEDALEILYLLRQEIFIAEGRRMIDLGIKFPLADLEVTDNPNAAGTPEQLTPQIPDFLPPGPEMDRFTFDEAAETVVILHNLNRVLAENRTSPLVLPFF